MAEDRQLNMPRRSRVEDADYVPSGAGPNVPRVRQDAADDRGLTVGLAVLVVVILLAMGALMRSGDRLPAGRVSRGGVNELAAAAEVRRPPASGDDTRLGVETQTVTGPVAVYYTLKDCPTVPGVQVCAVDEQGAADLAGVEPGDVITALGGREILSTEALRAAAEECGPGAEVALTVYRGGEYLALTAVLPPPGP